jgi:hypothetical protein
LFIYYQKYRYGFTTLDNLTEPPLQLYVEFYFIGFDSVHHFGSPPLMDMTFPFYPAPDTMNGAVPIHSPFTYPPLYAKELTSDYLPDHQGTALKRTSQNLFLKCL